MLSNPESQFKILGAITSISEDLNNIIEVVDINLNQGTIDKKDSCLIKFPASKIMWSPMTQQYGNDHQMLAVASDKLRLYNYSFNSGIEFRKELQNIMLKDLSGPLTSFDWSPVKNFICCSSIDTTCSIFDINQEKFYKQLIAHDKEVESPGIRRLLQRQRKFICDCRW